MDTERERERQKERESERVCESELHKTESGSVIEEVSYERSSIRREGRCPRFVARAAAPASCNRLFLSLAFSLYPKESACLNNSSMRVALTKAVDSTGLSVHE